MTSQLSPPSNPPLVAQAHIGMLCANLVDRYGSDTSLEENSDVRVATNAQLKRRAGVEIVAKETFGLQLKRKSRV